MAAAAKVAAMEAVAIVAAVRAEARGVRSPLSALYRVRPTGEREWLSVRVS